MHIERALAEVGRLFLENVELREERDEMLKALQKAGGQDAATVAPPASGDDPAGEPEQAG